MNAKTNTKLFFVAGILMLIQMAIRLGSIIYYSINSERSFFAYFDNMSILIFLIVSGVLGILFFFRNRICICISMILYTLMDIIDIFTQLDITKGLDMYNLCRVPSIVAYILIIFVAVFWYKRKTLIFAAVAFDLLLVYPLFICDMAKDIFEYSFKTNFMNICTLIAGIIALFIKALAFSLLTAGISLFYSKCDEKSKMDLCNGVCSNCGAENNKHAKFCDKCGKAITISVYSHVCNKCKTENAEGANHCMNCGNSLTRVVSKSKILGNSLELKQLIMPIIIVGGFVSIIIITTLSNVLSNKVLKIEYGMTADEVHNILGKPDSACDANSFFPPSEQYSHVYFAGVCGELDVFYSYNGEIVEGFLWDYYFVENDTSRDRKKTESKIADLLDKEYDRKTSKVWEIFDGEYRLEVIDEPYWSGIQVWYSHN